MGDVIIQDNFGDCEEDAPTEEISDWFILCEEDKGDWDDGNYIGADKP